MSDRIQMYEPLWGAWYVDKPIGAGNFGKVYRVKRKEFGETYYAAVKIITIPQHDSEIEHAYAEGMDDVSIRHYYESFTSDLLKEIRLMSSLKGTTNIVSIEDHQVVEKKDGIGWDILIRMELLTNFNNYLAGNSVARGDVIKLGMDICNALEFCRKSNIVHRDIKPDNIFVSPYGDFKLGDFGIARQIEKTASGLSKKGTFSHMAPEVYKGDQYNATVDIYSLGIVLYRLLNNNRVPFLPAYPAPITYQDRENALVQRMRGDALPTPDNADDALAEVVLRACAYNPRDRYSTPGEMRKALASVLPAADNDAVVFGATSMSQAKADYYQQDSPEHDAAEETADYIDSQEETDIIEGSVAATEILPYEPKQPVVTARKVSKLGKGKKSRLRLLVAGLAALLVIGGGVFAATQLLTGGEAFALAESELLLNPDGTRQLMVSGFDRGDPSTLVWESDNPEVAVVCPEGIVTAVGAGTATITVRTAGGETASAVIDVVIPVSGVVLDQVRVSLLSDGEVLLSAAITPENASNQNVTWSSSNEAVATVDDSGLVKAAGKGEAVISVTTEDGEITAVCIVTVGDISLSLAQGSMTINVGSSVTLEVEVNPPEASEHKLLWSSSDSSVADVNQEGKVTPKAPGEAVITVATEDGEVSASTTVTVLQPVTGVTLNRSSHTLNVGDTFDLSATVAPGNASEKGISWSSTNTSVATVSSTGRVTAVSRGTATITVTTADGNKTATCSVTVTQPVTGVSLNKSSLSLNTGQSETLNATVSPADANNKSVSWSSSNTSVATVNSSGRVSAVGRGTATITVTTADGNKTATCSVTVRQLPTGVSLNKSSLTLYVGEHETLNATVSPSDANNKDVTWSSSNTSVATVNSSGRVTAVGPARQQLPCGLWRATGRPPPLLL